VARLLHWLVAAGVALQFLLAKLAENAGESSELMRQLALLANHKSTGITLLGLVCVRLLWRLFAPIPSKLDWPNGSLWQQRLAIFTHYAFYLLLFALPVSGWLMSSASAYSVSWFGQFQLPDLVTPSQTLKATLQTVHNYLGKALLALALLHIAAALKHYFFNKDLVMQRMAGPLGLSVFAGCLILGGWSLAAPSAATPPTTSPTTSPTIESVDEDFAAPLQRTSSRLPAWEIDYQASHIKFTATQAGATFSGRFRSWQADIRFDTDALAQSSASVSIDATSIDTADGERDTTLATTDWFDSSHFATLEFVVTQFGASSDGTYVADAQLSIRGQSYPVRFEFDVTDEFDSLRLKGNSQLDRLALNLGVLEWQDTDWVGRLVDVEVLVVAGIPSGLFKPAP
jgi:cytochrome b561